MTWEVRSVKSLTSQKRRRQIRLPPRRIIGKDFPDHRGELESMAAEPAREDHAGQPGVMIDDEMRVGAVGVETGAHRQDKPISGWNVISTARPERLIVGGAGFTIH